MKKACKSNLPALIFLLALLILWQLGAMEVNAAHILPTPVQILQRLWQLRVALFTVHLPATMVVTAVGLAISLVLGLGLAVLMDASPFCRKAIYPVVVASQTIPTTAIAPLFVLWFGYGIWSKVLVTVLITFFPITITVYDGLQSARVEMMELLKAINSVGTTVVVVTHERELAARFRKRTIMIDHGEVVDDGLGRYGREAAQV